MTAPDDPVLRAALMRLRSALEDWSGGDPSPCVKVSTRDRDVLVAALAGRPDKPGTFKQCGADTDRQVKLGLE